MTILSPNSPIFNMTAYNRIATTSCNELPIKLPVLSFAA